MGNDRLLEQLKRKLQRSRRGFNILPCRTEPGTDSGRVSPRLMVCMMLGMAYAGGSHRPVHHNDAEQQGPNEYRSLHCKKPIN
jgi:hypothetical protein